MDVVVATVVVVTAGLEEDHVVVVQAIITTPEVDTVVVIVKETAKGTTRIMIVIKVMVIATEWNAALIRVVNVPTKATTVGVATKETMANEITRVVLTDHLETEEETLRMRHEATVAATVADHPEELLEDHLEELVVTMEETHRTLKSKKRMWWSNQNRPILFCFEIEVQMPAFFLRKRLLRHLDSETGIHHHFQLYFSFLLLSITVIISLSSATNEKKSISYV